MTITHTGAGSHRWAVGVGHILGPARAAILSGFGLLAPIIGAAVMSAVTLLLTVISLEETVTTEKKTTIIDIDSSPSIHSLLSKRPIVLVITTAFVIGSYVAAVMTSFSLCRTHFIPELASRGGCTQRRHRDCIDAHRGSCQPDAARRSPDQTSRRTDRYHPRQWTAHHQRHWLRSGNIYKDRGDSNLIVRDWLLN